MEQPASRYCSPSAGGLLSTQFPVLSQIKILHLKGDMTWCFIFKLLDRQSVGEVSFLSNSPDPVLEKIWSTSHNTLLLMGYFYKRSGEAIVMKHTLKQYYEMWWERKNFTSHFFFHHTFMYWPLLSPYFKPSVYSCWVLCVLWNIVHSMSSHSLPQCTLYRHPGKGKVIADCIITFIFTRYSLFLMFYRFM